MKLFLASFLLLFHYMTATAQEIFPAITDFPSLNGSKNSIILYNVIKGYDNQLKRKVNQFNGVYAQRSTYLVAPLSREITNEIHSEINEIQNRYLAINQKNNSLGLYHYSIKKKNKKILDILYPIISNLYNTLGKQHSTNVLLGEKMNLYQNAMASMNKIHRQLDIIADNIDRSLLVNQILGVY
ncbi:hypothetical protein V1387_17975 [Allomuricauda taeanensis]|uniref:hypothetical protein n=1 Tax=Flagellimonas taeanensis TaxID=1005926 RepID=UPI002E7C0864|nr:hypothetical protein [Allomuricauda taeanensis]MEE1964581.1 hypothetical protein [Allomuricauda taeanensis]